MQSADGIRSENPVGIVDGIGIEMTIIDAAAIYRSILTDGNDAAAIFHEMLKFDFSCKTLLKEHALIDPREEEIATTNQENGH